MLLPNIIKIPHHGSEGSNKLINIFKQHTVDYKINIATTTAYQKHGLPRESVISGYKNLSNLVYRIKEGSDDVATIRIGVDIIKRQIKVKELLNYIEC